MSSEESVLCDFENGALLGISKLIVSKEFAENGRLGFGISTTDNGDTIDNRACAISLDMPRVVVDGGETALGVSSFLRTSLALIDGERYGGWTNERRRLPGMVTWIFGRRAFADNATGISMEAALKSDSCFAWAKGLGISGFFTGTWPKLSFERLNAWAIYSLYAISRYDDSLSGMCLILTPVLS